MAHTYQYHAKDLMGNDVQGILEGPNEQDIARQLREKAFFFF
jgi:type II secretory pathway component PulF